MSKNLKANHHPLIWILIVVLALALFIYITKVRQQYTIVSPPQETSDQAQPNSSAPATE